MDMETLKNEINKARKSGDKTRLEILKVICGDVEMEALTKNKTVDQDLILSKLKKMVQNNDSNLKIRFDQKLVDENLILSEYLPKNLTYSEIKDRLSGVSNSIKQANTVGAAIAVAMKELKGLPVNIDIVKQCINSFRE